MQIFMPHHILLKSESGEGTMTSVLGLSFSVLILFIYIFCEDREPVQILHVLDKHSSLETHSTPFPQLRILVVTGTVSYLFDVY